MKGFPMESYTKSKSKDEAYEMKVLNLEIGKVDKDVFDTSGYIITEMSNMGNMGNFGDK